jgi:3-dehydroquinate dehydratase/shikimate dehydrogenase
MHNAAFAATDINAVYIPFDVSDADEFFHRMLHPRTREMDWRLRGLSITAPHKSAWMSRLDWVEASATEIGAVNTVVIRDNALHGYNTDAPASLAPLAEKWNLRGARVAILGAGGAARATLWSLRERGVSVTVFARDAGRARETARQFGASVASLDGARFAEFDIVINATPLGTRGRHQDRTPALANQLRGAQVVYDLVYNPSETRLLREARDAGCETLGGLPMLVAQAAAQFKLWTGHDAPVAAMRDAATKQLAEVGS